jgi:hypothetical protein
LCPAAMPAEEGLHRKVLAIRAATASLAALSAGNARTRTINRCRPPRSTSPLITSRCALGVTLTKTRTPSAHAWTAGAVTPAAQLAYECLDRKDAQILPPQLNQQQQNERPEIDATHGRQEPPDRPQ